MEDLKRLSQNGFRECFQRLYSRWQKCIVAQGKLCCRKCSVNDCIVLCLSEIKGFREHLEATANVVRLYPPCFSLASGTGEGYCHHHHRHRHSVDIEAAAFLELVVL